VLRPLRAAGRDVETLRAGAAEGRAAAVVRVAGAVETALRRLLRDDPTAPVDLRLRALSPDDLPTDALLAELRGRGRLPLELAAGVHELTRAGARIAAGGEATERDAELARAAAEGLEAHTARWPAPPLEDPLTEPEETLIHEPEDEPAHAVPTSSRATYALWTGVLGVAALAVLFVLWLPGARGSDGLVRAEAALSRHDTGAAIPLLREYARENPADVQSRLHLSRIHRARGQRAEARQALSEALATQPQDPGLNAELGFLLLDADRPADAARRFRAALGQDPDHRGAWGGLVRALREGGQPDAAARVLALAPADVRALLADTSAAAAPALGSPDGASSPAPVDTAAR
jgi:tetratricopeptide (TPR) repeat protein